MSPHSHQKTFYSFETKTCSTLLGFVQTMFRQNSRGKALLLSLWLLQLKLLFSEAATEKESSSSVQHLSWDAYERQISSCTFVDMCYPLTKDGYLNATKTCESILFEKNCCCNIEISACEKVCVKPCEKCPTPTPLPTPTCTPPPNYPPPRTGWFGGDPHIHTYDGLHYDCDACGEFTVSKKASCPKFEIQSRFYIPTSGASYSLVSDVVVAHENTRTIQVSLVRKLATPHIDYLGGLCKIAFYINGVLYTLGHPVSGHTFGSPSFLNVDTTSTSITIKFLQSGMVVRISFWNFIGYCAWGVQHILPSTISHSGIIGLLGTPDSISTNDWTDASGTLVPIPGPPVSPADGTLYCNNYWRLVASAQSLFTYEPGTSFASIQACVAGSWNSSPVRLSTNTRNVNDICGRDADCIKEYENGGEEAAIAYTNAVNDAEMYFIEYSNKK